MLLYGPLIAHPLLSARSPGIHRHQTLSPHQPFSPSGPPNPPVSSTLHVGYGVPAWTHVAHGKDWCPPPCGPASEQWNGGSVPLFLLLRLRCGSRPFGGDPGNNQHILNTPIIGRR